MTLLDMRPTRRTRKIPVIPMVMVHTVAAASDWHSTMLTLSAWGNGPAIETEDIYGGGDPAGCSIWIARRAR